VIRRLFRLVALAGVAAGVVAAVRALTSDRDPLPAPPSPSPEPWPPLRPDPVTEPPAPTETPQPGPAAPVTAMPEPGGVPVGGASYVEPTPDGQCPDGYPIKAKLTSKIFHAPGQLNYDRTTPDRCYIDAAAAEADGMRAAKR
jgi:hypothetical protein